VRARQLHPPVWTLLLLMLTACVTFFQPRAGPNQPQFPGDRQDRPDYPLGRNVEAGREFFDEVCRAHPRRTGWIAVDYRVGGELCPAAGDGEPHNVALIERFDHKPRGAIMVVCADQAVPRNWTRDDRREVDDVCPGARVRDGSPTAFAIRRVR
jgi:hypothetical protein